MTKSTNAALWTGVAYLIIHQVEGNLLVPLIQRHLVFIPPAVILLGIVALTFLFGPMAIIIIAAPITVVIFVAVKVAYVRDSLGEATRIPEQAG